MAQKKIDLHKELKRYFGFDTFKGDQEEIIKTLLSGDNAFVLMPTGGGKSLCYQLPALVSEGVAIVVSPLIALMKNQVDAICTLSEEEGLAHFLNSTLSRPDVEVVKEDVLSGRTKILYLAPETLTKEENINFLRSLKISFYAIDEAHCISEWGHDFRPEYRRIRELIEIIGKHPIIALTATATPKVQQDILKTLEIPSAKVFKSSFNRANLYYEVRTKRNDVDKDIVRFILKEGKDKSGIIYCLNRKKVEELSDFLNANGISSLPYHAGMPTEMRSSNQDAFLMEKVQVIVATIAFGMGIDKPDVRFVIHYNLPKSLDGYYQETGRAGRDGGEGKCILYYNIKDVHKLLAFLNGKPILEQEISQQLLYEIQGYSETSMCRRKMLLHYFGEDYRASNCHNCDNCLHPQKMTETKDILKDILELVVKLKENFKAEHIADVLLGHTNADVAAFEHDKLDAFGSYAEEEGRLLNGVLRQAVLSGYVEKEVENYGILKLTAKGKEFLKKPTSFKVSEDREFEEEEEEEVPEGGESVGAGDEVLFSLLKDLRKSLSTELKVPPYVIFQDPSLEAMSTTYPITMEELANIPGVGAGKAKRYGDKFVELIKRYVHENEIERPDDLRLKNIPHKSKNKIAIIQAIDRKVSLDEVASNIGMEFADLLKELEAIVYSGTKLNINYFIDEVMDSDSVKELYQYFKESPTDNVRVALKEFGDTYTQEEIRLVRIKFISEMAN